jgi:hypothetical protein
MRTASARGALFVLVVALSSTVATANATRPARPDTTWTQVPSPSPGTGVFNAFFSGVSAISATDAWAVGQDSANPQHTIQTLAEHWYGTEWAAVKTANRRNSENQLNGVAAISANDVWAVGYTSSSSRSVDITLVEHWNGTRWSIVPSPNVQTGFGDSNVLKAVSAVSSTDVWATGWAIDDARGGIDMLFEHWDGTRWSIVSTPSPIGAFQFGFGIDARTSTDVWAVGYDAGGVALRNLAAHWDGSAWSIVPTPNVGGGSPPDNHLFAVTAIAQNDVWAVGWENNIDGLNKQLTITMHWDGSAWVVIPSPNPNTSGGELFGVTALSSSDVWAVGESRNFDSGSQSSLTMQWNGSVWTVVDSPNGFFTTQANGAASVAPGTVWAVGSTEIQGQCCLRTFVLQTTDG